MACSSSCPNPGSHPNWGACVKAKGLQIGDVANHDNNRKTEKELQSYRDARSQGVQPDGTRTSQIRVAMDVSDATGVAYGSTPAVMPGE